MRRILAISIIVIILCGSIVAVNITPMLITQDGLETDTIITQELFTVQNFQFNIGFNLKRFGFDVGYQTPWLFRGIIIHSGIYHKWADLNKQFAPAFGIGISVKF